MPVTKELNNLLNILPHDKAPMLTLLEEMTIPVIIADENTNIIYWNRGAQNLFGYTKSEIIGGKLESLMPERFRTYHKDGVERFKKYAEKTSGVVIESKIVGHTTELEALKKDGSEFPIEMSVVSYNENNKFCFLAVITDLSPHIVKIKAEETVATIKGIEAKLSMLNKRIEENPILLPPEEVPSDIETKPAESNPNQDHKAAEANTDTTPPTNSC